MPDLTRLTQPNWGNLPLGQGKAGAGIDPMTAIMLLVTMGPQLLKMIGGGSSEPSPRDLRTEGDRAAGIVRRSGQPESAGQNILSQMAMARKPRTTTTHEEVTEPEEGLDIGSLMMMLMMMGGKKNTMGLGLTSPFTSEGARDIPIPGPGEVPGLGGSEGPDMSSLGNILSLILGLG